MDIAPEFGGPSYADFAMGDIQPSPASTIVVIRDQYDLLEILMLRRSRAVVAASGAHVFPGGGLEEVDAEVVRRRLFTGLTSETASRRLNLATGALPFYCAALRELFEEAGVLIVTSASATPRSIGSDRLGLWREELLEQRITWPDFLEREGLYLGLGQLEYLAHWVTPLGRSRRFDTRFFVAPAPSGQLAIADESEIVEHVWSTANNALARFESGEWSMLVPTVHTLRELSAQRRVADTLRWAAHVEVTRIQPREIERDGRVVVVIPGERGYDEPA